MCTNLAINASFSGFEYSLVSVFYLHAMEVDFYYYVFVSITFITHITDKAVAAE